ncbi:hypothetical protein HCH97_11555 [Escherichia coli]|uniref:hypothetical protein n=1 Tax=Enterobacteriaceae TaxID=543 RepID=UPI000B156491|nr:MULTISPECIES: hypothetical protein [Enterobacteriaceae]EMF0923731.1 hypothetical protein [Klebsiella aerogenes]HCI6569290.1 hypothetical protein [Klebsiella variicola subsp. variicola]MBE0008025.1 hypothetical protein [Citrobacter freundii]MBI0778802.1 hypothetical protein [Escherichia coli]HEM8646480.1 hypothetical protein [Klebsiella aerogenes]
MIHDQRPYRRRTEEPRRSEISAVEVLATLAVTTLCQYIDQNGRLPFTIETRVYRPEESLQNVVAGLQSASPRHAEIARILTRDELTVETRERYRLELAVDISMLKDNLRLFNTDGHAGEHLQHYIEFSLNEAFVALTI